MCKLIADLAGSDLQVTKQVLHRLEQASASPGIDIRLTSEIYGKLHMKVRELGLDPNDTTPHELYKSLQNLTLLHDKFLAKKLGIVDIYNPSDVLPTVIKVINRFYENKQIWVLKPVAIKRILKANPPKVLMKQLNYRSLESMLKRESPRILLTAARDIEPQSWQNKIIDAYKKISSSDFELQNIEIVYLDDSKWSELSSQRVAHHHNNIVYCPESGTVIVLPMQVIHLKGITLASFMLILHWVNEIRIHSTFFKFHHMRPNFGSLFTNTLSNNSPDHAIIAGQSIHWRIVHRYYGSVNAENHPDIFNPHLQSEDLAYRKAEELLYRFEPALHFWHDIDYVGFSKRDGPLSFNLMDNVICLINSLPYENRVYYHLRDSVWNEIYSRYLGQKSLENQLLHHLDNQSTTKNVIPQSKEFVL